MYIVPPWFAAYGVLFEFLFAIATLLVALSALRIHRLTGDPQSRLLGTGFALVFISYVIQSLLNFIFITNLKQGLLVFFTTDQFLFYTLGTYIHLFLFICGLATITYLTCKIRSWKVLTLMLLTMFIALFFSEQPFLLFYAFSALLLVFISIQYIQRFAEKKKTTTLLIFLGFAFLFIATINYFLSTESALHYVLGHFFELAAYGLIFISLRLVER